MIEDGQPLVSGQFNITIGMSLRAVLAGWTYVIVPKDWSERDADRATDCCGW